MSFESRLGEAAETSTSLGQASPAAEAFHLSRSSPRRFEDVLARLRESIAAQELRLLNEIDPQKAVEGIGQHIPGVRLLFFFHPDLVVRVMEMDWTAMVEAPLKLVVSELPTRRYPSASPIRL